MCKRALGIRTVWAFELPVSAVVVAFELPACVEWLLLGKPVGPLNYPWRVVAEAFELPAFVWTGFQHVVDWVPSMVLNCRAVPAGHFVVVVVLSSFSFCKNSIQSVCNAREQGWGHTLRPCGRRIGQRPAIRDRPGCHRAWVGSVPMCSADRNLECSPGDPAYPTQGM